MKKIASAACACLAAVVLAMAVGCSNSALADAYSYVVSGYSAASLCFEITSDGSCVTVDTNPYDLDDYLVSGSTTAIRSFHDRLGLPDYIWTEMSQTRYLDGRQTETVNGYVISWTFHPDRGLEATYRYAN